MKTPFYFFSFLFLFCIACKKDEIPTDTPVQLTDLQQRLVDELNDHLHPISGASPELDDSELSALDFLGEAQIVGLGEATHGTREFFQMKHRIFKYLVEKHDFRVFAFEMDFAESFFLDDYVTWKTDENVEELMKFYMLFWTWRTEEVADLLRWMRAYNEGKPFEEMLRFVGVDCQFSTYNADKLVSLLMDYDEAFSLEVKTRLKDFRRLSSQRLYDDILEENRDTIREDVEWVWQQIKEHEDEIIEITSVDEYEIIH